MNEKPAWRLPASLEEARSHGLREDEYQRLCEVVGRELTLLEVGICASLYSEHCSYKSTKVHLRSLPTEGPRVIQGPGENAGVVSIGNGEAVVFKVESHNHPTYIEPFQGAATGVGGILRDVFTMGARPLALMNSLRFGSSEHPRTAYLLNQAVAGIGTYGNCMGIPTVGGELFFHPAYNGNCLVNAFALGLVKESEIFLGHASGVGNPVVYVGSKTGRDGIQGATMASEVFDSESEAKRPTVQVGDPFQEKLLLEACLEVMQTGAVVGIQDMGAAGLTSSSFEMASRAGNGLRLWLDRVPQRAADMTPYELMLSESQERMLLVVDRGREAEVQKIFEHWELDAVVVGEVIDGGDVELFWHGECVSAMPVEMLTESVPEYRWPEEEPKGYQARITAKLPELSKGRPELERDWIKLLGSLNLCSRAGVYQQYDSTVRTNTVVHPGGDAAVIRIKREEGDKAEKGIALTLDCNSRYCSIDPKLGAEHAVLEAFRNISAVGAFPIGISDCLNYGSPERPEGMWEIAQGIRGLGEASKKLDAPIVSGNVSLYNETEGTSILPTPLVAMVGLIEDSSLCVPIHFQDEGDQILVLGAADSSQLGGSAYLAEVFGFEKGALPAIDYDYELKLGALVRVLVTEQLVKSCHDISDGGLAIALSECCFAPFSAIGASLKLDPKPSSDVGALFSEHGGRYIISASAESVSRIEAKANAAGVAIEARGSVGGDQIDVIDVASIDLSQARAAWESGLNRLM